MSKQRFIESTGITEGQADRFIEAYLEKVRNHYQEVWQDPAKGTRSEEYAVDALYEAGIDCVWDGYDHASGADLTIGESDVSMKSTVRKNKNVTTRSDISGSRLTSYGTLKKMLEALGNRNYNDMLLVCRRKRKDVGWCKRILRGEDYREVYLIWIPGDFVEPNDYDWNPETNSNGKTVYYARDFDKGQRLKITPSMSSQYWIKGIDFEEYLEPHILGSARIDREDSRTGMRQYESGMHLQEISQRGLESKQVRELANELGWTLPPA